jgi:hypothetical protein
MYLNPGGNKTISTLTLYYSVGAVGPGSILTSLCAKAGPNRLNAYGRVINSLSMSDGIEAGNGDLYTDDRVYQLTHWE